MQIAPSIAIWTAATASCFALAPADRLPEIGTPAPRFVAEHTFGVPQDRRCDLQQLEGTTVVLEFWATWCGPCIAAIPHINQIASEVEGLPVQFIAIAFDPPDRVAKAIEKRPIRGWVAADPNGAIFEQYGVVSIPRTVVVGPDGKIAAVMRPMELTSERLRAITGTPPRDEHPVRQSPQPVAPTPSPRNGSDAVPVTPAPASEVHCSVRLSLPGTQSGGGSRGPGKMKLSNAPMLTAVGQIYGVWTPYRIEGLDVLPQGRVDIDVRVPESAEPKLRDLVRDAFEMAFEVHAARTMLQREVYVLTSPGPLGPDLTRAGPNPGHSGTAPGILLAESAPIGRLVVNLESVLNAPVVDETGLEGNFAWDVQFTPGDRESLLRAVREQLGLAIAPGTREIEILQFKRPDCDAAASR